MSINFIKWKGRDKNSITQREFEETNMQDLYYSLTKDNRIINTLDEDPYDRAVLEKNHKTWEDFYVDGELEYQKYTEWLEKEGKDLTDKEIYELICEESMDYYEYIIEVEEDDIYREISDKDFDRNGKLK